MSSATSRSTSETGDATELFERLLIAKLLRLGFATAALRGSVRIRSLRPSRHRLVDPSNNCGNDALNSSWLTQIGKMSEPQQI